MKIDERTAKLICNLEYLIGSQCYNPNSYDGWNDEEGREFRYPVNIYPNEDATEPIKTKANLGIDDWVYFSYHHGEIKERNIRSMKYKFGSNHLYIGLGIIDVLNYIERRYGIDFNQLEAQLSEITK